VVLELVSVLLLLLLLVVVVKLLDVWRAVEVDVDSYLAKGRVLSRNSSVENRVDIDREIERASRPRHTPASQ
jgi:hypothetical protein